MKTIHLFLICLSFTLISACDTLASQQPVDVLSCVPGGYHEPIKPRCPPPKKSTAKNPMNVSIYHSNNPLKRPYKILAVGTVSKYNLSGIKRQQASIHDTLRKIAAAVGGDAIIDLKSDNQTVTGKIITYVA
jgi:hypothetical protein